MGDNPSDAAQKVQQTMRNPSVRNMMSNTNVNAKVHLKNEHVETNLKHDSISNFPIK